MRWNGHDPRQIDLLMLTVLVIAIVGAWGYFADSSQKPSTASFVVPSQTVRW